MKRTRNDWAWLYRHSCGHGSKLLMRDEEKDQPFKLGKIRTSIDIKSITKTATPWNIFTSASPASLALPPC